MSQTFAQLINGKSATVEFSAGSASTPAVSFSGDTNTGIYSPGADQVAISTSGTGRLFVDSSGRLGLGTSSPSSALDVAGAISLGAVAIPSAGTARIFSRNTDSNLYIQTGSGNTLNVLDGSQNTMASFGASTITLQTGNSPRLTIDSSGRVGIGTTTPATTLEVNGTSYVTDLLIRNNAGTPSLGTSPWLYSPASGALAIATNASERVRIDSSGRLLVGTSTARTNFNTGAEQSHIQLEGTTFNTSNLSIVRNSANDGTAALTLGKSRSATVNGNTVVVSGDPLGFINFEGADGTNMVRGASITAQVDGTPGTNDMPGRLVFSTTADGASSPTERMRIRNDGHIVTYDFGSLANPTTGMVAARGFSTRTGLNGSYVGNAFNFNWTGNLVAYIDSTNIGNVTLTSDYRIKRNIEDQAGEAIARIKQLRPVTYQRADYGDLIKGDDRVREGFIAHEVAEVIPSGVEGEKDAENQVQSLNIDAIVSVLTKALQEAVAKIETLEAKVAALEAS
jgi:hypothetical protein